MVFELKMKKQPEVVDAGTVKLVGIKVQHIVSETSKLLDNQQAYDSMA